MRHKGIVMMICLLAAGLAWSEALQAAPLVLEGPGVKLSVDTQSGAFAVERNGKPWLGAGAAAVRRGGKLLFSDNNAASLQVVGSDEIKGNDGYGGFQGVVLHWQAPDLVFDTTFKVYVDKPMIVFSHDFPQGYTSDSPAAFKDTSLNFPVFRAGAGGDDLNLYAYSWDTWVQPQFGKGVAQTLRAWGDASVRMPLFVFTPGGDTAVLSPLDDFLLRMVRVVAGAGSEPSVAVGLNGELESLPAGHSSPSVLLFHDGGMNAAMRAWGDVILAHTGKSRVAPDATFFLKYLGYWTDNGAYYYYRTEPGRNYQDTLLELKAYLDRENIPVRLLQLDSWWYPKSEKDRGVLEWIPLESMFPDGLESFREKLGLPLTFHNRYFAIDTPYMDRMPFIGGEEGVHPTTQEVFDEWADSVVRWGGIMYEQDWLNVTVRRTSQLRRDPALGRQWLTFMNNAMESRGLEIQYCMPTLGHIFASAWFQNVTNIRSANDYKIRIHGNSNQLFWEHAYTSPMIRALGALPFKDVIITTPPPEKPATPMQAYYKTQSGEDGTDAYILFEPFNHEAALQSILSAGPVGIGDRTGYVDKSIVSLMADEQGLIIKPDDTFLPVDRMYTVNPISEPVAMVHYASSQNAGLTWYYVFAQNVHYGYARARFEFHAGDAPGLDGPCVVYDFANRRAKTLDPGFSLDARLNAIDYIYYIFAPLSAQGRALIGDVSKYAAMSPHRIASWADAPGGMDIALAGPDQSSYELMVYALQQPAAVAFQGGAGDTQGAAAPAGKGLYSVNVPPGVKSVHIAF